MAFPFEFAIEGPPVSQQTRRQTRRRAWQRDVAEAAGHYWDGSPPSHGMLTISITYVFDTVEFDVDNIAKPILDAMKGIIYLDDNQIVDLICRKRHRDRAYGLGTLSDLFDLHLQAYHEFIHVHISLASEAEVSGD